MVGRSVHWLVRSKEHTNFTYDLTPRNRDHLAWWVADITGVHFGRARDFISELEADDELRRHVRSETARSDRRGLADPEVRFGRRAGWYALLRATQPEHVVETGTDKGLGTCVMAAALLQNGHGRLTTIDTNPDSGYLVTGRYRTVTERVIGDSIEVLSSGHTDVDMFLHDSLHTYPHEVAELEAVSGRLRPGSTILSDNAHDSDALADWAEATGRRFSYFREEPENHWLAGEGIGAAWTVRNSLIE